MRLSERFCAATRYGGLGLASIVHCEAYMGVSAPIPSDSLAHAAPDAPACVRVRETETGARELSRMSGKGKQKISLFSPKGIDMAFRTMIQSRARVRAYVRACVRVYACMTRT